MTSTLGNTIEPYDTKTKIKQIQLEQDSGKSLHDYELGCSLIDLNRAGDSHSNILFTYYNITENIKIFAKRCSSYGNCI